ncbi:MAG: hypothetical protein QXM25_01435 [Nitrososphaerales archaeon]
MASVWKPYEQNLTRLTEEFVRNRVLEWLSKQGYGIISRVKTISEHGVDIKVRKTKSYSYFVIEVKGDPPTTKHPEKIRHPAFLSALGEIVQRVKHERHYRYALALPSSFQKLVFRRLPWVAAKKIGLEVLLVDAKGKVTRITWREIKEHQTKR